jgi:DNA-binding LacI/PurR family transcriptional regulator/DNA-binding transcriptional regulator YhcF (GntR family)
MASVSKNTMLKAIELLAQKGLVSASERFRVRAGSGEGPKLPPSEIRLHRQRVRAIFERDLLSGLFGFGGSLPSVKELQARYGVSFSTMKLIMTEMVSDGLLEPYGRGYRYPEIHHTAFRPKIVFVTLQGHLAQISALNSEHNRITNLFESEIKRRGIFMEIIEVDFFDTAATRRAFSNLTGSDSIVGYILDVWWYGGERYRDGYLSVLNRCIALKKPVAILDELGEFELPVQHAKNPQAQVYTIESRGSGSRMARFLIELGHRNGVYLSPFQDTVWSRERYAGIVEQFSRIGRGNGVHLVADQTGDSLLYMLMMSGLTEKEIYRVIAMGRTPAQSESLKAQWQSFAKRSAPHLLDRPDDQLELRESLRSLPGLMRSNLREEVLARLCSEAIDIGADCFAQLSLKRSFVRALAMRDVTVWICANDSIAFEALAFLRANKIRVPHDISVVGFDNLPARSLEHRLTTFDFNAMGFVQQMLGTILRPPRTRASYRHETKVVEGLVIERETTARAHQVDMTSKRPRR